MADEFLYRITPARGDMGGQRWGHPAPTKRMVASKRAAPKQKPPPKRRAAAKR
jgi:hypothetical protein